MSLFQIEGGFQNLAVSSRVRLARNLKSYHFRGLSPLDYEKIADDIFAVLQENPALCDAFEKKHLIPHAAETEILVETHVISPALAEKGNFVILSKDRGVSIMIGEEDHLRIQVIGAGLCSKECLETANRIADLIELKIPFAYNQTLGYLTTCPTNLGTGLRSSVMLHLPMLTELGEISQVIGYAASRGCAVRGAYGEGSKAVGGFYQISNQISLGLTDNELTDKLIETTTTILEAEKKAREKMRAQSEIALQDRISRAVSAMKSCYLIQTSEAISCISNALVGLQMGYVTGVTPAELYSLEEKIRPAFLRGSAIERDSTRANLMRETAKKLTFNE